MRILFLTNFYPPHGSGGEEQSCRQVVEALKERGNATLVLTSMHGTDNASVEADGVYRSLYLEMDLVPWRHGLTFFTRRKAREKHNLQCFERVVARFEPDIVFIWGMWNLPKALAASAEARCPERVVYRFATYWPTLPSQHELYWRARGRKWYSRPVKMVLGQVALAMLARENSHPPLSFKHVMCVSAAAGRRLVEAGIPITNARIIYTGLDVTAYLDDEPHQPVRETRSLNLLYAGRLSPDKGVDTAIKAMAKLVFEQGQRDLRLGLAGSGSSDYENELRHLVSQAGLTDYAAFLGWVPPEEMPGLLREFDVLLVPSIWAEPFARVVLEGMIAGLVVVATPTGGTPEIVVDGENGLLFTPGDPDDLARKITLLLGDPAMRRKLAWAGQHTIRERFTMPRMIDEIERLLQEVAGGLTAEKGGR